MGFEPADRYTEAGRPAPGSMPGDAAGRLEAETTPDGRPELTLAAWIRR